MAQHSKIPVVFQDCNDDIHPLGRFVDPIKALKMLNWWGLYDADGDIVADLAGDFVVHGGRVVFRITGGPE